MIKNGKILAKARILKLANEARPANMLRGLLGIKTAQYADFPGDIHDYAEHEGVDESELGRRGGLRAASLNRRTIKLKDGTRLLKPRFGDYSFDTLEPELARRAFLKRIVKRGAAKRDYIVTREEEADRKRKRTRQMVMKALTSAVL